jgi:hypothetical protein
MGICGVLPVGFFWFLRGELGKLEKEERVVLTTFMCCLTWCAGEERKHNKNHVIIQERKKRKRRFDSPFDSLAVVFLER